MKIPRRHLLAQVVLGLLCWLLVLPAVRAEGTNETVTVEAQLIWGTNDEASPKPNHKPVEAKIAEKLQKAPFKWKNYFEEERKCKTLAKAAPVRVELSKSCAVDLTYLGNDKLEVNLIGDGKPLRKIKETVAKDNFIVIGGDVKDNTAWIVLIRKVEKKK